MKALKIIIYKGLAALIITGVLSSCDDKIRELQDLSLPPSFLYFKTSSTNWEIPDAGKPLIDSAKVWNINNNASYPMLLKIGEPQKNFAKLTIIGSDPKSSIFVNDNIYSHTFEVTTNQDYNLAFRSPSPSTQDFKITTQEIFDRTNSMVVRIIFKENRPPIPKMKIILADGTTKDYQINATGSYDIDKAIGGAVMEYEYTIDNVIIKTSESSIRHIFKTGSHVIKLRVMDNDKVWSDYNVQTISI